jgi:hypothetical protein
MSQPIAHGFRRFQGRPRDPQGHHIHRTLMSLFQQCKEKYISCVAEVLGYLGALVEKCRFVHFFRGGENSHFHLTGCSSFNRLSAISGAHVMTCAHT